MTTVIIQPGTTHRLTGRIRITSLRMTPSYAPVSDTTMLMARVITTGPFTAIGNWICDARLVDASVPFGSCRMRRCDQVALLDMGFALQFRGDSLFLFSH